MPKESFRHNIFFAFVREPFITKCFVLIIIIIITIIYNKNLITNILYRVVNDWRHMYINPVNELLRFFLLLTVCSKETLTMIRCILRTLQKMNST